MRTLLRALLQEVAEQLAASTRLDDESRADAKREARLLVAALLELSPGALAQRLDGIPSDADRARILTASARRARGEPLAYCVGTAAFRHLVLMVDARVLIPRPETEIVVDEVLRLVGAHPGGVAVDIGTGSGAIAAALATEGEFDLVVATDVSADALVVAARNVQRLPASAAPVELRAGADLAPLAGLVARVIVSNPPYIAYGEAGTLPSSVRDWEPAMALFASDEGMARYGALLAGAGAHLEADGWLVLEVDARRAQETARRATARGFADVRLVRDLSGRERVLVARNSPQVRATAMAAATSDTPRRRSTTTNPVTLSTIASGPEAGEHARR